MGAGAAACGVGALLGCFEDAGCPAGGCPHPLLPHYQAQLHDKVTLEACALACHELSLTVAGIDAGNHCHCGGGSDLSAAAARSHRRPLAECEVTPCHAAPAEKCGGPGRLLAFNFSCSRGPAPPPRPPPPPPAAAPQCNRTKYKPPYKFGRSFPAFAEENLTSWGGNAVKGDDGKYHMFTSVRRHDIIAGIWVAFSRECQRYRCGQAMSNGRDGNAAPSDLIPGPCSVGSWERNSLVVCATILLGIWVAFLQVCQ